LVREHNEDRFGLFPELGLYVVADGMGGAAAGEVAAQMAVDLIHEAIVDPDETWPNNDVGPLSLGQSLLVAAIRRANHRIHGVALQRPEWRGMGTTIVALLLCGARAALAHVGDSRVYRVRGRRLERLTEDHSLWNALLRRGLVDAANEKRFTRRNVITRNLGDTPDVEVEARWVDVIPGDTFLLCSDGLHGTVDDEQLAAVLREHEHPTLAVARLIQLAKDHGGPDNITAALVRIPG
jgi:protein phosphatase